MSEKLQRIPMPAKSKPGEYDNSKLPYGVLLSKVLNVQVDYEQEKFPTWKQNQNIDMVFTIHVQPERYKFPMKMWIDIRFNFDENLMVKADDNWETPISLRSNIHELHRILNATGYTGGFTVKGEWADCDGDEVDNQNIAASLNTYITENTPEVYLFVDRFTDKDGKVRLSPLSWTVCPPTEEGKKDIEYRTQKRLQAIESAINAANGGSVNKPAPKPAANSPIKGRRF